MRTHFRAGTTATVISIPGLFCALLLVLKLMIAVNPSETNIFPRPLFDSARKCGCPSERNALQRQLAPAELGLAVEVLVRNSVAKTRDPRVSRVMARI